MRQMLVLIMFMLATLIWAAAQQPGGMPGHSAGQATSPSSQVPDASQQRPSAPGSADQNADQAGAQAANAPITEGCLGGSNPNFTITDNAGTTYKLNIPPGADASSLTPHVGESVQVEGAVERTAKPPSIDVSRIGRGTGKCPASGSSGTQAPPKQ
jgi:uncharacterized protein YdeI (BOF family)